MKTITYKLGEESHVVIEKQGDFSTSIFSEVYSKVDTILEEYKNAVNEENTNSTAENTPSLNQFTDPINNIIAFLGERGSGKTSCMLSKQQELAYSENSEYLSLDMIDPSFFDEEVNILGLIVAQMFNWFKLQYNKDCKIPDKEDKQEGIIQNFTTVQNNIAGIIGNESNGFDHLNQLVEKAASIELRKNMKALIQSLLEFYPSQPKKFMLITIDDLDLNTQYAYTMVEQIRKYLIHSNVIILMAIKLDQLKNIIKTHYRKEFPETLYVTDNEINEMADRYLGKFLPLSHRVYLPSIELAENDEIIILDEAGNILGKDGEIDKYAKKEEKERKKGDHSIKETILSLIFRKTRFLFYNSQWAPSPIIPTNLRELLALTKMLVKMGPDTRPYNKVLFQNYFFQTWIPNNLNMEGQKIMKELRSITNTAHTNKYVLTALKNRFKQYTSELPLELRDILDETNMDYNISLGDVILFIRKLNPLIDNQEDIRLLFAIKSYYSMLLYKYYDEMTETKAEENPFIQRLYKHEQLNNINSYFKLVGGCYINGTGDYLIPLTKDRASRSCREIDGNLLMEMMKSLSEFSDADILKISYNNKTYSIPKKSAIILAEFFALCTDIHTDKNIRNYRKQEEVYYQSTFNEKQKNIRFYLTSFFYNIIHYKAAINRYPFPDLAKNIMENKDSIYQSIKSIFLQRYEIDDESDEFCHLWQSWTCIRNIELLEDIIENMIEGRPRKEKYELTLFGNFFQNIGTRNNHFLSQGKPQTERGKDYYIFTYDTEDSEKREHYQISFGYATCIGDKLMDISLSSPQNSANEKNVDDLFEDILKFDTIDQYSILSIKNLSQTRNRNETIRKLISTQYPDRFPESILNERYPDKGYMSKEEAENTLNEIAKQNG